VRIGDGRARVGLRRRGRACAVLALTLVVAACGDRLKWTEDVLLPDGRTVTLTRYQEFKGPHPLFEPPTASFYWFEFRNPDTGKKVRWEDDRDLATVALSVNGGVPELLTTPQFGGPTRFRCPDPPFIAFQFVNGAWVRVPLQNVAAKVVKANMTTWNVGYLRPKIEAQGRHLSADFVAAHLSDAFAGRTIDLTGVDRQRFGDLSRCGPPLDWYWKQPRIDGGSGALPKVTAESGGSR